MLEVVGNNLFKTLRMNDPIFQVYSRLFLEIQAFYSNIFKCPKTFHSQLFGGTVRILKNDLLCNIFSLPISETNLWNS